MFSYSCRNKILRWKYLILRWKYLILRWKYLILRWKYLILRWKYLAKYGMLFWGKNTSSISTTHFCFLFFFYFLVNLTKNIEQENSCVYGQRCLFWPVTYPYQPYNFKMRFVPLSFGGPTSLLTHRLVPSSDSIYNSWSPPVTT